MISVQTGDFGLIPELKRTEPPPLVDENKIFESPNFDSFVSPQLPENKPTLLLLEESETLEPIPSLNSHHRDKSFSRTL